MKVKDLTGQKFGMLTVLSPSTQRLRNVFSWDCVCDCGNSKTVTGADLRCGDVKSCGCNSGKKPKDIAGKKFGKLTAISNTGKKSNNGDYIWNCTCDCGNTCQRTIGNLNFGSTRSCGCIRSENSVHRTHGMSKTKAYTTWRKVKERCYNKNCQDYPDYGAKGIVMSEEFKQSFEAFYNEIGDPPENSPKWSIDRIDYTKNYEAGNLRWADSFTQARNKGKSVSNTSGVTGVVWDVKIPEQPCCSLYASAMWNELVGESFKPRKKSFSVKKFGLLPAFAMACKYREDKIKELNAAGYGYSDNHGK